MSLNDVFARSSLVALAALTVLYAPPSLSAAPVSVAEVRKRLNESSSQGPLTVRQFREITSAPDVQLDLQEWVDLFTKDYTQRQKPMLSVRELADFWKAKRGAIHAIRCEFRRVVTAGAALEDRRAMAGTVLASGRMMRVDAQYGASLEKLNPLQTLSFDGEYVRTLQHFDKGPVPLDGKIAWGSGFKPLDHPFPLFECLLADSQKVVGSPDQSIDLAAILDFSFCVVQEQLESVNGQDGLLVVANEQETLWLDPRAGYAPVQVERGPYRFDSRAGRMVRTTDVVRRSFSANHDIGNGMFFPSKIENTVESNGKVIRGELYDNITAELNPEVNRESFSDVFPRTTSVYDETKDAAYLVGNDKDGGSISALLDREVEHTVKAPAPKVPETPAMPPQPVTASPTVPPPPSRPDEPGASNMRQWLVLANVLALAVIGLAVGLRYVGKR